MRWKIGIVLLIILLLAGCVKVEEISETKVSDDAQKSEISDTSEELPLAPEGIEPPAEEPVEEPIEEPNEITGAAVVCNDPYILVGTECCLDHNDNNICDKDDIVPEPEPEPVIEEKPDKIVLPTECSLTSDLECVKVTWSNNDIVVTIKNKISTTIKNIKLSLNGPGCYDVPADDGPTELKSGKTGNYTGFAVCDPKVGSYDLKITATYTSMDAPKKRTGSVGVLVKELKK